MQKKAHEIHEKAIVLDAHNHLMIEIAKHRDMQEQAVFSKTFAPQIRQGGVNVILMVVGGDSTSLTDQSDLMLWGSLRVIDKLLQEAEESSDSMSVCLNAKDLDNALGEGKIAVIMGLEGGRPLEGKPNMDTLSNLRNFYRLGVRQVQLVDMGRNRIGDGTSVLRTEGKLTPFGIDIVKEMNRLGMVIDVAHLNDPGFYDVIETTKDPIVDSHSNTYVVNPYSRTLSDERIREMAKNGGVIGLSCYDNAVCKRKVEAGVRPTLSDFIEHLDHIVELVGTDHVGIGPDHFEDHGFYPAPGWMEGRTYLGVRDSYHVADFADITQFGNLTEALVKHGYSDEDIYKVLGENLLRIYRQVMRPDKAREN